MKKILLFEFSEIMRYAKEDTRDSDVVGYLNERKNMVTIIKSRSSNVSKSIPVSDFWQMVAKEEI